MGSRLRYILISSGYLFENIEVEIVRPRTLGYLLGTEGTPLYLTYRMLDDRLCKNCLPAAQYSRGSDEMKLAYLPRQRAQWHSVISLSRR